MLKVPPSRPGGQITHARRAVTPSRSESNGHCIAAFAENGLVVAYDTKAEDKYGSSVGPVSLIFQAPAWGSLLEQAEKLRPPAERVELFLGCRQTLVQFRTPEGMYSWRIFEDRVTMPIQRGEILSTSEEIVAFVESAAIGDYQLSSQLRAFTGASHRSHADLEAAWRKSSHSTYNGNCTEVVLASRGEREMVAVRDSKLGDGSPVLEFTPAAWRAFTDGVKAGEAL